ncbi:hypothetical protein DYB32_003201 [Aphanomyces invadans]|uniref:Uncharacterized protein n=1 Tax=Aphanomyces invadans TaxID=157072 RepID=A0A3R6YBQ3_9STRA|nr:hypothetical protein DYB32_003201 [Aphanomyces invadans]
MVGRAGQRDRTTTFDFTPDVASHSRADKLGRKAFFLHVCRRTPKRSSSIQRMAVRCYDSLALVLLTGVMAVNLGHFAMFLDHIAQRADDAEEYYLRAIDATADNALHLSHYANEPRNPCLGREPISDVGQVTATGATDAMADMNKKIEEDVVKAAGVAVIDDDGLLVADDEWTEEREELAKALLEQDTKVVPPFWQNKYEKEAAKSWDLFYKRNSTNFYKDRYGHRQQPLYDPSRCHVSVCDITTDPLPAVIDAEGGVHFALFMFCLSALHPDKMQAAVQKIADAVKPAQLRFKPGHKLADNFYVRQDNTRAYYFTIDEVRDLFVAAGLVERENEYIRRQYSNRSQGVVRFRVWVHAIFEKPL